MQSFVPSKLEFAMVEEVGAAAPTSGIPAFHELTSDRAEYDSMTERVVWRWVSSTRS
ncbi:hypothetical protein WME89_21320 [Sorangium sp. So ce321]|uniref:hypothetical protein n=1 Tax=Sorangium sp. So ce321 TaxID=3133300 RepID=UPI003F5D71AF